MLKLVGLLIGVLAIAAIIGGTVYAVGGDDWADSASNYIQGANVLAPHNITSRALGPVDNVWLSLGDAGSVDLRFDDNIAIDGPGPDLTVYEFGGGVPETFELWISNGGAFVKVADSIGNTKSFDIAPFGLGFVTQVRIVDRNGGATGSPFAGFDLDAVKALHSIDLSECQGDLGTYNVVVGTAAGEVLNGTKDDDLIIGLGGDDELQGSFGDDCLIGGPGEDTLRGSHGDDVLLGGDNDDLLEGGQGNDHMDGGANDTDPPGDECKGGNGLDTEANCETGSLGRGQP